MGIEVVVNSLYESIEFPVLMKSTSSELVVLFPSETYGVCIVSTSTMKAGTISDNWASCYNKSKWEKFSGKITLENK